MESKFRILLVEDEISLARGLIYNLEAEGYEVELASDGLDAMAKIDRGGFDLIVLDLVLPHVDGYEVLKRIRGLNPRLPVIILTAKLEETDRVRGLELGADDYLTKPFHLKELLLRIKGMLRRFTWYAGPKTSEQFVFGPNRIDFNTLKAYGVDGKELTLTVKEAHLLRVLIDHEGRAMSRQQLLEEVWGYPPDIVTRTVDAFIARLRAYFEPNPKKPVYILSLRGLGYRFVKEPE
ncbi:MAG: response regulator transcription factor [Deltaproteobacteria bacterium]|nr:response regulator transcription factor [Deltaproteobacteria bacterium]MBW2051510.1 response regulator transcription factor [Deltaproteobacteria bacterium]MBW2140342.1 response regulator transcription factor [Deltaproteobacteria bacterium]MBW2323746.1 response regulator transcription factor [Deltaproteobacteria bacterium]